MTTRGPYAAYTPDAAAFDIPNSALERVAFIPAPEAPSPTSRTFRTNAGILSQSKFFERFTTFLTNNTGLLLVASSQLFFALMNTAVKKLNSLDPPVPALELVIVRMGITYICCMTYMYWKDVPDPILGPKGVRLLLAFRGFSGFFGLFGVYYSLQYLSLSDATVLTFLAPLATALAGCLILGEAFSRKEALAGSGGEAVMSLVGVVLIARPQAIFGTHGTPTLSDGHGVDGVPASLDPAEKNTSAQRLTAVGVALIGVLGATGAYTSLRAIGKRAHTLHSLTSFSVQCVIAATASMIILRVPLVVPSRIEWLALFIMIGTFGFLAQVLLTMGLQRETAGRGTMAVYVQIIFATILERIFFHNVPSALSILGTIIIMGSAIYVALIKENAGKIPAAPTRAVAGDTALELEDGLLLHDELSADADSVKGERMLEGKDARERKETVGPQSTGNITSES